MELTILNTAGEDTGRKIELQDSVFGIEPNEHAIYLDVKQFLANQRQGTHKSKERADISGSTAKIKKQKGTGTARAGSIKSPLFRGGGRCFGPRPRNYSFKLNKKLKQLARKSALSVKAKNNALVVVEDFNFEAVKTKMFVDLQNNLKVADKKELHGKLFSLVQHIKSNMPFLHKQFTRSMDKTVSAAKSEIEEFYNSTIMKMGKKALENGHVPKKPMIENKEK